MKREADKGNGGERSGAFARKVARKVPDTEVHCCFAARLATLEKSSMENVQRGSDKCHASAAWISDHGPIIT